MVVRSTTFVFKALYTCIQKNGVIHFQTGVQQHEMSQSTVASRCRARRAVPRAAPHTGCLSVSTRAAPEVFTPP
jgi:hypothetical protein